MSNKIGGFDLMMDAKIENNNGAITISPNVFATIAGDVAMRCYGVVGMATKGGVVDFFANLTKDPTARGVEVKISDEGVELTIHIVVLYGTNIKAVSDSIISDVKYQVENMTGFKINNVNVNVDNVQIDE